jgi:hypothetical protein
MKKILGVAVLSLSFSSIAATIKITSFNFIRSPLAELCGQVSETTTSPTFVNVTVDRGSKNPGAYNTVAGTDGKFCMAVITYRGLADASIIGGTSTAKASIR